MTGGRFVVQQHDATRMHYDLRLELGGVLRSWAVPRGPSLDPRARRLAVPVADHDLDHLDYEGIDEAGPKIVWDTGTYDLLREPTPDHLAFALHGQKLTGGFALTRTGERWILVKMRDASATAEGDVVADQPRSVRSGHTIGELAEIQTTSRVRPTAR